MFVNEFVIVAFVSLFVGMIIAVFFDLYNLKKPKN